MNWLVSQASLDVLASGEDFKFSILNFQIGFLESFLIGLISNFLEKLFFPRSPRLCLLKARPDLKLRIQNLELLYLRVQEHSIVFHCRKVR